MQSNGNLRSWKFDLVAFNKRNTMRPTRIEVLDAQKDVASDFWIEDGMLLSGVDLDVKRHCVPSIEIMLETTETNLNHMTHTITDVRRLDFEMEGKADDTLEIEDGRGTITILRFESAGRG
jgi:hypothetical protein